MRADSFRRTARSLGAVAVVVGLPALALLMAALTAGALSACAGGSEDCAVCDVAPGCPDVGPVGGTDTAQTADTDTFREPDVGPRPGFEPCRDNSDCESGLCVPSDDGQVCTVQCLTAEGCPSGWVCRALPQTMPDVVFVCFPEQSHLCQPCATDYECGGGFCLEAPRELDDGVAGDGADAPHYCARSCSLDYPCPDGFDCETRQSEETGRLADMCVPRSGRCDCSSRNDGERRACLRENEHGTCVGYQVCDGLTGWEECTAAEPQAELCNGADDDCDGLADEEAAPPAEPCVWEVDGLGACEAEWLCAGVDGWECPAREPQPEACNYLDDDCDGETDEDFRDGTGALYIDPGNCGACGLPCAGTVPNGEGECVIDGDLAMCRASCTPGFVLDDRARCVPIPDLLCLPCDNDARCAGPGDRCLELDDGRFCARDCGPENAYGTPAGECPQGYECRDLGDDRQCVPESGACSCAEESDGATRACVAVNAHGRCFGVETCDAGSGWSACTAELAAPEVCNGLDDDCSGAVDDLPGRGDACANENAAGSCPGVLDCGADEGLTCVGPEPAEERCNYRDDDCDGDTDETFPGVYAACTVGRGVCRRHGVLLCAEDGDDTECSVTPGEASDEVCDNLDNDCDGATDEDPLWAFVGDSCVSGRGACQQRGILACDTDDPAGPPVCTAAALTGDDEVCNGVDDDCDGETDEGWLGPDGYVADDACGNCYTDCQAVYERPAASGVCCAPGREPACAQPECRMVCDDGHWDLNGVPDDGCEFALDDDAIYVSVGDPDARDDAWCGAGPAATGEYRFPCASISAGVAEAVSQGRSKVIVADGLYREEVTVADGVSLLGGFRPDTWERHVDSSLTVLRGPDEGTHRRTLFASGVTAATVVEGFVIEGADATAAGGNSQAVFLINSDASLVVRGNTIVAGRGGPGAPGATGVSGAAGADGAEGASTASLRCEPGDTFDDGLMDGGAGGVRACQDPATLSDDVPDSFTAVGGGDGGHGVCPDRDIQAGGGTAGVGPELGDDGGGGAGGAGGWGHSTSSEGCSVTSDRPELGERGADGRGGAALDGAGGEGCVDPYGHMSGSTWRGGAGADGLHGAHGSGGGGGGAGGGQKLVYLDPASFDVGGAGGGGGSGGCAAQAGGGGGAGGASFAVLVYFTPGALPYGTADVPTLTDNEIRRGFGGAGGGGGAGGAGGGGGAGGVGGAVVDPVGPLYCVFPGADGGHGGRGGHGGGGGGGCGGTSFGVAGWNLNGVSPSWESQNRFPLDADTVTGGAGGAGGGSLDTTGGTGGAATHGAYGNVLLRD